MKYLKGWWQHRRGWLIVLSLNYWLLWSVLGLTAFPFGAQAPWCSLVFSVIAIVVITGTWRYLYLTSEELGFRINAETYLLFFGLPAGAVGSLLIMHQGLVAQDVVVAVLIQLASFAATLQCWYYHLTPKWE